jgi:hypothetical protein
MVQTRIADHEKRMLRLVALSVRRRLLRAGTAAVSAPRVSSLAAVDIRPSPFLRHADTSRCFSSQTEDDDDADGSWTTLALSSPVAWREAAKPALLAFLKVETHLMVPVAFTVPYGDAAWPRAAWGYPLGKHAAWLRKQWRERGGETIDPTQLKELNEMQFAWDWSQYKWDHIVLPALRRYFELNDHTDVPNDFVIPEGDPQWPERLWGLILGRRVNNIRSRGDFFQQVEADANELERLAFCHDSTVSDRDWREKVLPALKVFRQQFKHCAVSRPFTVPASPPWPEAAWNMRLGGTVQAIRSGYLGAGQYQRELEELGFVWDFFESEWSERILPALEVFRQLNGHCRVPKAFVVPSDEKWPEQSRGLKLGNTVNQIRTKGTYAAQVARDKSRLLEVGFVWDFNEAQWRERILPAWEVFYKVHGHCRVPRWFVVPSEAPWTVEAHGMTLGNSVWSIRERGGYFDHAVRSMDALAAIEFELKIPALKWTERVEPLLAMFEQLHGHRNVPHEFVVPSRPPWRAKDWGIPLGKLQLKAAS